MWLGANMNPQNSTQDPCCGPTCCVTPASGPSPSVPEGPQKPPVAEAMRAAVVSRYDALAREGAPCCGPAPSAAATCCDRAKDDHEPAEGGLGCGNPLAVAGLRPGECVLDLGCGTGLDAIAAAHAVGPAGKVIGVDMSTEMLRRARQRAETTGLGSIEFRLGEIEHLPVADGSVDVILSNCVVNLSPDKPQVFREARRVLRRGGRIHFSDILAQDALDPGEAADLADIVGCLAGAASVEDVRRWLQEAGLSDVDIEERPGSAAMLQSWAPGHPLVGRVMAATIEARLR